MIPDSVKIAIKEKTSLMITGSRSVHGGSINHTAMVVAGKKSFFLKWNHAVPENFFEKEMEGLNALRQADHDIIIPNVIATGEAGGSGITFLLMEYIESSDTGDSFNFGAELAQLHLNQSDHFGFHSDNFIGSLHQSNRNQDRWKDFFHSERLLPQLKLAVDTGKIEYRIMNHLEKLYSRLDDLLPAAKPSLLHGDLWGGNYLFNVDGNAVLIDPAVYYGHPEMDLAFSKMFGGFTKDFYRGYESVSPLEPGFNERISVYNLYPLLVHVNLFGGSYVDQVRAILQNYS